MPADVISPDCPTCAAPMALQPGTDELRCRHCKTTVPIPQLGAIVGALDYETHAAGAITGPSAHHVRSISCRTCGGTTQLSGKDTAGRCPFCKTPFVDVPSDQQVMRPHAVVPFYIEREKAAEVVAKWIGSRRFAPRALGKEASVDRLNGVYIPAWRFNANTSTDYEGERGERRTEHRTVRNSDGSDRHETTTVTDWYRASGHVDVAFHDVDVIASKAVHEGLTAAVEGVSRGQLRPFREEYFYGFSAETYEVLLPDALVNAKAKMDSGIDAEVNRDIGGDEQRIHKKSTAYSALTFWLLALPVWIVAYQYRGKAYQVVIDGFAGDIKGKRPFSWPKIVLAVVVVALIVAIVLAVKYRS